jgi:hypothetical protein
MMRFRLVVLCAAVLVALGSGCAGEPPPPVMPLQAPVTLQRLRVHVHNANRERAEHDENVNLYTIFLRQALERALVRAGYRVVGDPTQPYDVVAVVTLGDFASSQHVASEATASLTLRAGSRIVDQLSAIVSIDDHANLESRGPAALADAITRSPNVAAFAASLPADRQSAPVLTVPAQ